MEIKKPGISRTFYFGGGETHSELLIGKNGASAYFYWKLGTELWQLRLFLLAAAQ